MINKFLTYDMYDVLFELDDSRSGELVYDEHTGWWIDGWNLEDDLEDAIEDLARLRLIKMSSFYPRRHVYNITEDGMGCLDDLDYVPEIVRV